MCDGISFQIMFNVNRDQFCFVCVMEFRFESCLMSNCQLGLVLFCTSKDVCTALQMISCMNYEVTGYDGVGKLLGITKSKFSLHFDCQRDLNLVFRLMSR